MGFEILNFFTLTVSEKTQLCAKNTSSSNANLKFLTAIILNRGRNRKILGWEFILHIPFTLLPRGHLVYE